MYRYIIAAPASFPSNIDGLVLEMRAEIIDECINAGSDLKMVLRRGDLRI